MKQFICFFRGQKSGNEVHTQYVFTLMNKLKRKTNQEDGFF